MEIRNEIRQVTINKTFFSDYIIFKCLPSETMKCYMQDIVSDNKLGNKEYAEPQI